MGTRIVPLALLLAACGTQTSADDRLVQNAVAGKEEAFATEALAKTDEAPLPLARACDANGAFRDLFAQADANGDGVLSPGERHDVHGRLRPAFPPPVWDVLSYVYDTNQDATLDDAERAVLLDDFTARCEALQARALAEFDVDGSGDLDATEQAAAQAALDAHRPPPFPPEVWGLLAFAYDTNRDGILDETEHAVLVDDLTAGRQAMDASGRQPPDGQQPPDGKGQGGPDGRPDDGSAPRPILDLYDTNGDGEIDATEFTAMQTDVRAHLRAGDPPVPPPPGAPRGMTPPPLLDLYDTNGDGVLDDAEFAAMHSDLSAKLRAGEPPVPPPPGAPPQR